MPVEYISNRVKNEVLANAKEMNLYRELMAYTDGKLRIEDLALKVFHEIIKRDAIARCGCHVVPGKKFKPGV
jgi:hypothetical protein